MVLSDSPVRRRYSSLTAAERKLADRRLRLEYASGFDRGHAAAVARLIDGRRAELERAPRIGYRYPAAMKAAA